MLLVQIKQIVVLPKVDDIERVLVKIKLNNWSIFFNEHIILMFKLGKNYQDELVLAKRVFRYLDQIQSVINLSLIQLFLGLVFQSSSSLAKDCVCSSSASSSITTTSIIASYPQCLQSTDVRQWTCSNKQCQYFRTFKFIVTPSFYTVLLANN